MKHRWFAAATAFALTALCLSPPAWAAGEEPLPAPEQTLQEPRTERETSAAREAWAVQETSVVLVGLNYGGGALAGANLSNSAGSGFRLGYLDEARNFCQVGYTAETAVSVVKTQNVYYGLDSAYSSTLKSYSDAITSDVLVGCYHVLLPCSPADFEEASELARSVGGFPAWIGGSYQVRLGAYGTGEEARAAAELFGGSVVGTSAYGVSVVKTGTNTVLFQFDGGEDIPLTVKPGLDESEKTVTWFNNTRWYGGFQYRRVDGGNLTVINVVDMDDYVSCLLSQEMSSSWPMEALKAQAVCARNYVEITRAEGKHKKYGFDVCSTTDCQAYPGLGGENERTRQAASETAGLRVWYGGELAKTYYYASNGGGSEDVHNVWGGSEDLPYLCGVADPYEETVSEKIAYWGDTVTYTASQLSARVQPYLQGKGYNCAAIVDFAITELTPTGNVKSVVFTDANGKTWPFTGKLATDFRSVLGLRSIRYTVDKTAGSSGGVYYTDGGGTLSAMSGVCAVGGDGSIRKLTGNPYVITGSGVGFLPAPTGGAGEGETVFTFQSWGWGHSVGMSQWGAYAMAQQGKTFEEILTFYYPGVEIE